MAFVVGGSQLENVSTHVEVVEETLLATSEPGLMMLAQPSDVIVSSGTAREQQTAIVVMPVPDDGKNRIHFEYSQPSLLDTNRRIQPHTAAEILRVAVTGSADLRCNRSLEALCNAADSELKNIGNQNEQRVQVNDARRSNQVACVVNSVLGSSSRLVLPAIRLESDNVGNSHPEAVVLMQKPENSYQTAGLYLPVTSNAVSSEISISRSSVEQRAYLMSNKLPQTMQMVSSSVMQLSQRDAAKPSRHTCKFCGRVCAKPSVLQKHIRTHTGERPFPCTTCGLRFKTKSNLYKHCKSRTHRFALSGSESLSADETVSSSSGKPLVMDEETNSADVKNTVGTATSDDREEELNNDETVHCEGATSFQWQSPPQSSGTSVADNKVSADTSGSAACKLLTVIDGNMYVMEQVTLPSWQPVVQQLQEQESATMSYTVSPGASETRQSEQLNSHGSVTVAVIPNGSNSPAMSADSEVVPQINRRSGATREALQEHISRLISENASIINTRMVEAPRAKRILRQSSDGTVSSTAKQAAGRPLLRTRSLTPCPTLLPASSSSTHTGANDGSSSGSAPSEVSRHKLLHRAASETGTLLVSGVSSSSAGKQFLTVPSEPHCIDDVANRLMLLPSKGGDDTGGTDMQCSEVRIVLELADSSTSAQSPVPAEVVKEPNASHRPVLSTGVTSQPLLAVACKSPTSSQPAERHNPTLLPVPTFCMIKPLEQGSVSGSGHPVVQYSQANPVAQTVPLQCVLLGSGDVTVPVTSQTGSVAQSPSNSRPIVVEVVSTTQHQPRRGRPKGSKNRPKLAASASDPSGRGTPLPVTAREPLSAGVTSAPSIDSLWRLKLKDQLMRRSLSTERRASPARQDDRPAAPTSHESASESRNVPAVSGASTAVKASQLLSTSSLGSSSPSVAVAGAPPVIRSRSCDASVPPKKRRKTLTELGRGTAFGTRVEESGVDSSQSNKVAEDPDALTPADDCVFEPPPPSQTSSFAASPVDNTSSSRNLFSLTNRALQLMYNSPPRASTLCSSAVMHDCDSVSDSVRPHQSLFIRLPSGIGSKIPGLVRCSGSAVEPDSAVPQSPPMFIDQSATDSSGCRRHDSNVTPTVKMSTYWVSTCNSHSNTCERTDSSVSVAENAACSSVTSADETELFELPFDANASSSGTLLLLGHSYPSLGIVAEPTFCSILSTQPACSEVSGGGGEAPSQASMYDTWRGASGSVDGTNDKLELSARETFSLYRTPRLGKDLSYAAAPAFDSRSGGVLTHSSYWKYRTDRSGSDAGERTVAGAASVPLDAVKHLDAPSTSPSTSGSGTEKNAASAVGIPAEERPASSSLSERNISSEEVQTESSVAPGGVLADASQKRVWIFPGGYRSTESYVYVRGRGRGRYVCARCGVRCKKPSVLRKHLRSHTDARPHHCHVCDVGFKTKGNLSKHLNSKAHHLRSSELGSSGEQSGRSVEGYDADLDSSCELVPGGGGSTLDPESDSGCELQPGSSCEVETELSAVSVARRSSGVEADAENHCAVDKQQMMPGAETPDANVSSRSLHKTSASQNLYIDVSGHSQPLLITTALQQQKQAPHGMLKTVLLICNLCLTGIIRFHCFVNWFI